MHREWKVLRYQMLPNTVKATQCGKKVSPRGRSQVQDLLVANVLRGALPIQRQNLQLPIEGHSGGQKTNLAIASLILEVCLNRDHFPIGPQRIAEFRHGVYFQLLPDAEAPLKNWHAFLDRGQIENLRARVSGRSDFKIRE